MIKITRVEVIDRSKGVEEGGGRVYVNTNVNDCWLDLQDGDKTLKIFINESHHLADAIGYHEIEDDLSEYEED